VSADQHGQYRRGPPARTDHPSGAAAAALTTYDGGTITPLPAVQPTPAAPPPHYVIGAATATSPDPNALLGQLRSIGVVLADSWATAVRDLALEAQLVTPIPAAGVKCWRVDGDLVRWVELIKHGIHRQSFPIPEIVTRQQRAA
jgi:hypothetical protein